MSGTFSIAVVEQRGSFAVPADIDRLAVVLGCSSEGSDTAPVLSSFFLSGSAAIDEVGYGDAVDTLCQIIEQRQPSGSQVAKVPAAICSLPVDVAGTYGAIDDDLVTGLGTVTAGATDPFGTYEAGLQWVTDHVVGTTGASVRWTLDHGRNWSRATALGTATSFEIPNSGVTFELSPSGVDLTALNTLINELYTDQNAHVILTAGSVHGAADNADVVSIAAASDTATRIARINALRAAYELHRVKTAGGVHGLADSTNVIVAPVATDDSSALVLALDLKAKYNAHRVLTTGSVHGGADSTNATTAAAPAAGTFAEGDEVYVRTFGPTVSGDDVEAAGTLLANSTADFALLICDFDVDATMAAHVSAALDSLKTAGKRCLALVRVRNPDFEASETDAAWNADVAADFASFSDSRICKRASYQLVTDAMTSRQYMRNDIAQFAADVVRVGRSVWPCSPNDQPMANVSLVDADGETIGHDEGTRGASTGLSNDTLGNTFSCVQRLDIPTRREQVFNTAPWVSFEEGERIQLLMHRRIANAMERVAVAAGVTSLGGRVAFDPTGPSSGVLTEVSRASLQGSIYQAVSSEFRAEIDNADDASIDSGLVQVAPTVTVSSGNLLGVSVTLAPKVGGYVLSETFTLAIQG